MPRQFDLPSLTTVTVSNVNVRSELHGDDHVPAVDLSLKLAAPNTILSEFDGHLRSMLYRAADAGEVQGQQEIEGTEVSDLPILRTACIDMPIRLANEYAGYTLTIDRGLGGSSNITLQGCAVNKLRADCKQGGTVELTMRVQASGLDEATLGRLAMLIGCETQITLMAPHDGPVIDGASDAPVPAESSARKGRKKREPELSATDVFLDAHAPA